jgi:hypothetical protein
MESLGTTQKKGYLLVELRDSVAMSWRKFWFVLKENVLYRAPADKSEQPTLAIELEDYTVSIEDPAKFVFSVSFHNAIISIT